MLLLNYGRSRSIWHGANCDLTVHLIVTNGDYPFHQCALCTFGSTTCEYRSDLGTASRATRKITGVYGVYEEPLAPCTLGYLAGLSVMGWPPVRGFASGLGASGDGGPDPAGVGAMPSNGSREVGSRGVESRMGCVAAAMAQGAPLPGRALTLGCRTPRRPLETRMRWLPVKRKCRRARLLRTALSAVATGPPQGAPWRVGAGDGRAVRKRRPGPELSFHGRRPPRRAACRSRPPGCGWER